MALASTEWMKEASCRGLPKEKVDRLFFPDGGTVTKDAEKMCDACPVRDNCQTYTMGWEKGLSAKRRYSVAFGKGSGERARLEKTGGGRKKPGPKTNTDILETKSRKMRKCPFCNFASSYRSDIATHIRQGEQRPCIDCKRPSCVAPQFAIKPDSYVGPTICPACLAVSAAC